MADLEPAVPVEQPEEPTDEANPTYGSLSAEQKGYLATEKAKQDAERIADDIIASFATSTDEYKQQVVDTYGFDSPEQLTELVENEDKDAMKITITNKVTIDLKDKYNSQPDVKLTNPEVEIIKDYEPEEAEQPEPEPTEPDDGKTEPETEFEPQPDEPADEGEESDDAETPEKEDSDLPPGGKLPKKWGDLTDEQIEWMADNAVAQLPDEIYESVENWNNNLDEIKSATGTSDNDGRVFYKRGPNHYIYQEADNPKDRRQAHRDALIDIYTFWRGAYGNFSVILDIPRLAPLIED